MSTNVPTTNGDLSDAFRLPDLSQIDVGALDPADAATLAYSLEQALIAASALFATICTPVREAMTAARERVKREILDNGGTMLPHDVLDVLIERTPGKRAPRMDVLLQLIGKVPADQLADALYIDSVDVRQAEPAAIEALLLAGGKAAWKADLRKLDPIAKRCGPNSEIAKIVAEGSPRGDDGPPTLVIRPRESAIRKAGRP